MSEGAIFVIGLFVFIAAIGLLETWLLHRKKS